jgi:uncharacterized membrane protein YraQ (UPF0718 family)
MAYNLTRVYAAVCPDENLNHLMNSALFLEKILLGAWAALMAMAPYLLLGLIVAGFLHVALPRRLVQKHLGRRGFGSILKATLLGIPMPLCSCSVIPVAVSLRKQGGSKGATVSFLISTPQTGADNILATYGMLGPLFAGFSVIVTLISGLIGGCLTDWLDKDPAPPATTTDTDTGAAPTAPLPPWWKRVLRHAFLTLPRDFSRSMLVGLLLAGTISVLVPPNFLADRLGTPTLEVALAILFGIPLYVCATGSIPVAASLIAAGLSPGAAFAFLVSGPATNAATITTLWSTLGHRSTLVYLATIAAVAFLSGVILNWILRSTPPFMAAVHERCVAHTMEGHSPTPRSIIMGVVFLLVLINGVIQKSRSA